MKCQIANCDREINPENSYLVTQKFYVQKKNSFKENVFVHMVCKKCANAIIDATVANITIIYEKGEIK